jgi:hypothetical protein
MGAVAATAVPMAFFFPVRFLALVAVFSFYMAAFAGYRVLRSEGPAARRKRSRSTGSAAVRHLRNAPLAYA